MFIKSNNPLKDFHYKYWVDVGVMEELICYFERFSDVIYYSYESCVAPDSVFVYLAGIEPAELCVAYNDLFDEGLESLPSMYEEEFYIDFDDAYDELENLILKLWQKGVGLIRID